MKVLLLGFYTEEFKESLKEKGLIIFTFEENSNEFKEFLYKSSIVIIRSPFKLNDCDLKKSKNLKYIIRAGSGVEGISEMYSELGISLKVIKGNANAVSEQVIGSLIMQYRALHTLNISMKKGYWDKNKQIGREISEKKVGILGFGYIGQAIALKLYSLGAEISIFDRSMSKRKKIEISNSVSAELLHIKEIFDSCDIIINCLPLTKDTYKLINYPLFKLMKKYSVFVDVGRGGVAVPDDLLKILKKDCTISAVIDVYETEPPIHTELFKLDNVSLTPHTGAQTIESRKNIESKIYDYIIEII